MNEVKLGNGSTIADAWVGKTFEDFKAKYSGKIRRDMKECWDEIKKKRPADKVKKAISKPDSTEK